ncbi:MAG: UDP-2,3-diacylglucosamine diphosphatase [Burkholderiaceae bacterium]|jgi:UDP-2,3-diacylglucosamine hydrolase|nr:UDP-2,3-diacylglucosamine diphosphatase [Burkholderiaceae bacterium]
MSSSLPLQAVFVSDVHLSDSTPQTQAAFADFIRDEAPRARHVYILGDLFEYWAGDDDLSTPFIRQVVGDIRALTEKGTAVFWVAGNRDFLTGEQFARESGMTPLPDEHCLTIAGQVVTIAHGDAQCLDDPDYVQFRAMVRHPEWQRQFLAVPLPQRKALIQQFRKDSYAQNETKSHSWDVTPSAVTALFDKTRADTLVHGHTHRPGQFGHEGGRTRYVLPDWDCEQSPRRGGWLSLSATGEFALHFLPG